MISSLNKLVDWFITVNWYDILVVVIGPISVLIGIFVSEYFKKKNRDSLFSEKIFNKKIDIYEKLFNMMRSAYEINNEIINDKNLSKENRNLKWSSVILPIGDFIDTNQLYISDELSVHCLITLVGAEDLGKMNVKEKKQYYNNWNKTTELIKEESGLNRLDKFFGKINKPKMKSDYIEYFNKLKSEKNKKDN
jgi:hypothetical protein